MKKVLIVDDESGYRDQLELAISRDGFQVLSAGSGRQAIEVGAQHRPDVIVCDWMLQDELHGLHVIEVLSAVYPSLQSILISGFASKDLRAKADEQNLFGFLEKPFSIAQLKEKVNAAVDSKSKTRNNMTVSLIEVDENNSIVFANSSALQLFYGLGFDIVAANRNLASIFDADQLGALKDSDAQWVDMFVKAPASSQLYLRSRKLPDSNNKLYAVLQIADRALQNYSVVRMLLGMPRRDYDEKTDLNISGNILVVDDYDLLRRMTCEVLEDQGYTCHSAGTHSEAIETLEKDDNIALIILDYDMPDGTPEKIIETIRQTRSGTIVVGSSGGNHREDFEKFGVGLYLPKPWITQDLQNVLHGLM
jgi:DNA-binding NtrC family response regulator